MKDKITLTREEFKNKCKEITGEIAKEDGKIKSELGVLTIMTCGQLWKRLDNFFFSDSKPKKKIKDLTIGEQIQICNNHMYCRDCPLDTKNDDSCKCDYLDKYGDEEIEVD